MSKLKKTSGKECIKILVKHFDFSIVRRKGSHVILTKKSDHGKIGTVVPDHKELKLPTLKNILKLAQVSEDAFGEYQ